MAAQRHLAPQRQRLTRAIAALTCGCVALTPRAIATAADIASAWIGPGRGLGSGLGSGSWAVPGHWSPVGVPANTPTTNFAVTIDSPGAAAFLVTLDFSPAITSLTLGSGDTLAVDSNATLTLGGSLSATQQASKAGTPALTNHGLLRLTHEASAVSTVGVVVFDGSGVLRLEHPLARIRSEAPQAAQATLGLERFLANGSNHTIEGEGFLGDDQLFVQNNGTIRATNGTLVIDPPSVGFLSGFTNFGTLHAAGTMGRILLLPGNAESWGVIRIDQASELSLAAPLRQHDGLLVVDGSVRSEEPTAAGQLLLLVGGGVLAGTGSIDLGASLGDVIVEPGQSWSHPKSSNDHSLTNQRTGDPVGTLTFQDIAGGTQTIYLIDVRGTQRGQYDRIESTTNGVLDGGIVRLRLIDGFAPTKGDEIEVIHFAEFFVNPPTELDACFGAELVITSQSVSVRFTEGTGIFGDLDLDGFVGPSDLAMVLGDWGGAASALACRRTDLDANGTIDAGDLALLLGAWQTAALQN